MDSTGRSICMHCKDVWVNASTPWCENMHCQTNLKPSFSAFFPTVVKTLAAFNESG